MKKSTKVTLALIGVILFAASNALSFSVGLNLGLKHEQPEQAVSKYDVGPPDPQEMLELLNEERRKVGVAPLTIDENVQKSAQLKADDMFERNYYDHNVLGTKYTLTDEMAMYVRKSCKFSGENIVDNLDNERNTSRLTNDSFVGSKSHYEAMIDAKFTKVGFGVAGTKVVQRLCEAL